MHRGGEPMLVWIGHPWIEARFQNPYVMLTATSDHHARIACAACHRR